jgi:hypothetical protein
MVTMAQLILCNRTHRLDQRAARWLLQVDDRVEEAPFRVTQEFLAQMIGAQRPALSVAMRQSRRRDSSATRAAKSASPTVTGSWRDRALAFESSCPRRRAWTQSEGDSATTVAIGSARHSSVCPRYAIRRAPARRWLVT